MSRRRLLLLASVLVLIGAAIFVHRLQDTAGASPSKPSLASSSRPRETSPSASFSPANPSPPATGSAADRAPAAALTAEDRSRIDDEITDAVTTYDPEGLPVLERYLAHPDPEIRRLAAGGLQRMGLAEGAPILRAAAALQLPSHPEEATAYLKIADFLELPSARAAVRKHFQEKGTAPAPPNPPLPDPNAPANPKQRFIPPPR